MMDNLGCQKKIMQKNALIISYFIVSTILILLSLIPIGYSIKDNKPIFMDFTAINESYDKKINTQEYSEVYYLAIDDDIQINYLSVTYMADDVDFKGVLQVEVIEDGNILNLSHTRIIKTKPEGATIKMNFGTGIHLLKGHNYIVHIQIDTNQSDYCIKEFYVPDESDYLCKILGDRSIISNIEYTQISTIRYYELFYGIIPFLIVIGGLFLLKKLGIDLMSSRYIKGVGGFVKNYYNELVLLLMFIYLASYQLYFGYVKEVYISSDSIYYLREAKAILSGYGFNDGGLSGYDSWFVLWPIGYPLLIAAVAFITGRNLYLASKVLAIVLVAIFLFLLYIRFKKDAWIYSLCLLNTGFLAIYIYTWSENPFVLSLLIFCLILSYIIEKDTVKVRWYIFLGISSVFVFLCRYFGTFTLVIIGLVFLLYLGMYVLSEKYRNHNVKNKLIGLIISGGIALISIISYYAMNYIKAGSISGDDRTLFQDEYAVLTRNLWDSLVTEIFNAVHLPESDIILNLRYQNKALLVILFSSTVLYLLYKCKAKDFRLVFIGVGILYDVIFIFIRFHSTMDPFGSRFFVPATILITIGVLGCLSDWIKKQYWIVPIVILVLVVPSKVYITGIYANRENTAYTQLQASLVEAVSEVPYRSAILGWDIDYRTLVFRPDLYVVIENIGVNETMDDLFGEYENSDYISVKNKYIQDILFNPIYDYDKSVIDFFANSISADAPIEEYTIISVKEQKIIE